MAKASGPISAGWSQRLMPVIIPLRSIADSYCLDGKFPSSGNFVPSIRHLIASLKVLSLRYSAIRQMGDHRHPRGGSRLSVWRSKLIPIEVTSTMI